MHAFTKRPKGKIDVFQVWYREDTPVAVFDILRSTMISQIRRLHIVTVEHKDYPLWKEKGMVWKLQKELLRVLAEPYRRRLEEELVTGCVCELSKDDLKEDDAYIKNKLAESLGL